MSMCSGICMMAEYVKLIFGDGSWNHTIHLQPTSHRFDAFVVILNERGESIFIRCVSLKYYIGIHSNRREYILPANFSVYRTKSRQHKYTVCMHVCVCVHMRKYNILWWFINLFLLVDFDRCFRLNAFSTVNFIFNGKYAICQFGKSFSNEIDILQP